MKRKVEDELIKMAFGDMEPNGSDRAKRALTEDASAAKLLSSYAEIREGLKQLKTPEHQLSTERLRERILAEGLKPKAASPWGWRWTLGPVAVAAAALMITLRLAGSQADPMVGGFGNADSDIGSLGATALNFSPNGPDANWMIKSAAQGSLSASVEPETTPAPEQAVTREPRPAATLTSAAREPKSNGPSGKEAAKSHAMTPEEMSSLALDGALPAGAVALHQDSWGEEPIVLIGAESDEITGANRATEVSSASNVVVGG